MAFYQYDGSVYAAAPYGMDTRNNPANHPSSNGIVYFEQPITLLPVVVDPLLTTTFSGGKGFKNQDQNIRKVSADSGISEYSTCSTAESNGLEDNAEGEDTPFQKPSEEMCEQIVEQVEFYFSDANLTKDKFLLKHIKRNAEGYVSLKLVSSFKRVKRLTKDWRQVAVAIKEKSEKLEVNSLNTKVRRLAVLPKYDESTPSRTIVASNLPMQRATIDGVANIFASIGKIVLVRILRPGNPIPADIKPFMNKHSELTENVCAIVEFETAETAKEAITELNSSEEDGLKIMELEIKPVTNKPKRKDSKVKTSHSAGPSRKNSSNNEFYLPMRKYPDYNMLAQQVAQGLRIAPNPTSHRRKHSTVLNPNAPAFQMPRSSGNNNSALSSTHQPLTSRSMLPRRSFINNTDIAASGLTLPINVLRMPKGPEEGSKGFPVRRLKKKVSITTESKKEEEQPQKEDASTSPPLVKEKDPEIKDKETPDQDKVGVVESSTSSEKEVTAAEEQRTR